MDEMKEIIKKLKIISDKIGGHPFPSITMYGDRSGSVNIGKKFTIHSCDYRISNSEKKILSALDLTIDLLGNAEVIELDATSELNTDGGNAHIIKGKNHLIIIKFKFEV